MHTVYDFQQRKKDFLATQRPPSRLLLALRYDSPPLPHASRSEKKEERDCANQGEPKRLRCLFRNTYESILLKQIEHYQITRQNELTLHPYRSRSSSNHAIHFASQPKFPISTKLTHHFSLDSVVLRPVLTRTIGLRDKH